MSILYGLKWLACRSRLLFNLIGQCLCRYGHLLELRLLMMVANDASAASRPVLIRTKPFLGVIRVAQTGYQRDPRYALQKPWKVGRR